MVEQPGLPNGDDLDRTLRDLAPRLAYPPTPDVAGAVRARLAAGVPPRQSWWAGVWSWPAPRRLALAALLLALLLGALLAVPGTRRAIAGYLGVPGIQIISVTATPAPTPTVTPTALPTATLLPVASTPAPPTATASPTPRPPTPTATPTPVLIGCPAADTTPGATPAAGVRLCLGQPMSLADARTRVAFPVRVPTLAGLTQPDEVYVGVPPAGGQVSFVYHARPDLPAAPETGVGLLITQFRGEFDPVYAKKFVTGETQIDFPHVNGVQGYWLSGTPHEFAYRDANGKTTIERVRLAGNVLLWTENGVTYRIEGARTEAEALAIAASLR